MKNTIEKMLEKLIGFEFTKTTRTGSMECMKFGVFYTKDRKGFENQVEQFALNIQCPWRITKDNTIIVGSDDLTEHPDENAEFDERFDWDIQGGNLRDIKLDNLLKSEKIVVKSILADNFGGFQLLFSNNTILSVFPASSSKNSYNEYWRLLINDKNPRHFVVSLNDVHEV